MSQSFASNSSVKQSGRGATLGTATTSFVGVVRIDANTLNVDLTGTVSVNVGNSSQAGIVRPDGTSVLVTGGVISVATIPVATSSTAGTVRPDGTSVVVTSGVISISIAAGTNGYGARTVQSSASGVPSNSSGNNGDIIYQY
jgi:hypothetical protein